MCNSKILYQNENGCVARCRTCNHIKVLFSTTSFTLTEQQFYEFTDVMKEHYDGNKHQIENCRCIPIPTIAPSIQLLYSLLELKALIKILDEAYLSLQVEKLLQS